MNKHSTGMLNDNQIAFIVDNIDKIMVSYDGIPQIQNVNRCDKYGHGTSNRVIETVKKLLLKNKKISVRTTIWRKDYEKLPEMYDYLRKQLDGDFTWEIKPVIPLGRANNKADSYKASLYSSLEKVKTYTYDKIKIEELEFPKNTIDYACGAILPFCRCPWLLTDGTIVSCIESFQYKTVLGKVENNHVEWLSNIHDSLIEDLINKYEECKLCVALPFCGGGCPIKNHIVEKIYKCCNKTECEDITSYYKQIILNIVSGKHCSGWYARKKEVNNIEFWQMKKEK